MSLANEQFSKQKNRNKKIRVIFQIIFLAIVAVVAALNLTTWQEYQDAKHGSGKVGEDRGFIALAYFGVDRSGDQTLIAVERLQEQLQALKNDGYVTITQKDIEEYYNSGKLLPEKSVFLIFEDGRRDTAIFAEKILADLNFKATILTYSEKFEKPDPKFLKPKELLALQKSTYWEIGSNGHRLAFINVFDRYNNYLGELSSLKHSMLAPYLARKYNHYLMDYIRDADGVPKESYEKMRERIAYDYQAMQNIYTDSLGFVPDMYILMHSNTGSFGNNDQVSLINEHWIKKLFKMNFNREGFSLNKRNSSVYDLTRIQPQAYWYTNHLLMRLNYDNEQKLAFVTGDLERHAEWEVLKGALEVKPEKLIVTSQPLTNGLIKLKNSKYFFNNKINLELTGNKLGAQTIYLRADEKLENYLAISIVNNMLYVREKLKNVEREIYKLNLDKHDGKQPISVAEDRAAAEKRTLETFIKYADSAKQATIYTEKLKDKMLDKPAKVAEGAVEYQAPLSASAAGKRKLFIDIKDDKLSLNVDDKEVAKNIEIKNLNVGYLYLESSWSANAWSQRNLADDVYDGVFEKLKITENAGKAKETVLFDSNLSGFEKIKYTATKFWNKIISWFVVNM